MIKACKRLYQKYMMFIIFYSSDVNTALNLTASAADQSKPQRNRQRSKRYIFNLF